MPKALLVPAFALFLFSAGLSPCSRLGAAMPEGTPEDGWVVAQAAAEGFDAPRLQAQISAMMASGANLHGVIVERHGKLVAEAYGRGKDRVVNSLFAHTRQFGPEDLHDARSVGKSVIGLLVGIALQEGRLPGLQTPVLDLYPELGDLATPPRKAITLEHLLTMSSGLRWQEGGEGHDDEHSLMWAWSPVRKVLSHPQAAAPGAIFTYNSGGTVVVADLLARSTGRPWKDYARKVLFEPLGIRDWAWKGDCFGRPMSYTGLRMRPRDLAKLGRLVLDRGRWQGRQIIPASWIDASLKPRLATGFEDTRYGYFWWTGTASWKGRQLPWAAAFGNGAQRIYVVPDLDLCLVITAGAYGNLPVAHQVQGFFRDLLATVRE